MTTKVNILIDGGFFWQCFKKINKRNPQPKDVRQTVNDVMALVKRQTTAKRRIFYSACFITTVGLLEARLKMSQEIV